jgi:hypothetical protein
LKQQDLNLPRGCMCHSCPNYAECLAASHSIVNAFNMEEDFKHTVNNLADKIQTSDVIEMFFAYGGLMLGKHIKKWILQNYTPRKRKR